MLRSAFSTGRGRIKDNVIPPSSTVEKLFRPSCHPFSSVVARFHGLQQNQSGDSRCAKPLRFQNPHISQFSTLGSSITPSVGSNASNTRKAQNQYVELCSVLGNGYPELLGQCRRPNYLWIHSFTGNGPFMKLSALTSQKAGLMQQHGVRLFSSNGRGTEKDATPKSDLSNPDSTKGGPEGLKEKTGTGKKDDDSGKKDSLDPRAFLLGTREHLKKVTEWEVGDMVATYSIVLLLLTIVLSPIVGNYMRRSESTYDELDTDDQVADMSRILRRDFFDKISEDGTLGDKGAVDFVLADVLSSKALQEQAIKFVVSVVQSEEVKKACQNLLKELWNDLIKDPETTAQVIYLLHVGIQNEDIRLATKQLVLEIVEDEEVLEELVHLLRKLGQDKEVLNATQTLLTESAHNTLNDPEILDHSMEFATDVVGDDVVQRTAGEALRNSLSYAVQPGISIVLASLGVGLLFFSVMSLGYARSSEQDAAVLDQAVSGLARSLQPKSRLGDRIWKLLAVPVDAVVAATSYFFTTVLLPFQFVQSMVARVEYTGHAAGRALEMSMAWLSEAYQATISWIILNAERILSYFGRNSKAVEGALRAAASWISRNFQAVASFMVQCGSVTQGAIRGLMSTLAGTPGACIGWVSRTIEMLSSYIGSIGTATEAVFRGTISWFSGLADALSRRACSMRASPFGSIVAESFSATITLCQRLLVSFATLVIGQDRTETNKGI